LEINEIWEALMELGLVPKVQADKMHILNMVSAACDETYRSEMRVRRRYGGLGLVLMYMCSQDENARHGELQEELQNYEDHNSWMAKHVQENSRVNFKDFLSLLSKVRSWHSQHLRDELLPIFERKLKRRHYIGAALSIPDVCSALEELKMAPQSREEQEKIAELLELANEWGFDPPSLDFEAFVKFVQKVKEWMYGKARSTDVEYAKEQLDFNERQVNMYRMAFDILDTEGTDNLKISAVRQVFVLLRRAISSDSLREFFAKIDLDGSGTITFLEFLHLVHELESGRWGHEVGPDKKPQEKDEKTAAQPELPPPIFREDSPSPEVTPDPVQPTCVVTVKTQASIGTQPSVATDFSVMSMESMESQTRPAAFQQPSTVDRLTTSAMFPTLAGMADHW
jgi:hypothetical protein